MSVVNIYFMAVGRTKTGRRTYKLSDGKGHAYGRAFTIKPNKKKKGMTK